MYLKMDSLHSAQGAYKALHGGWYRGEETNGCDFLHIEVHYECNLGMGHYAVSVVLEWDIVQCDDSHQEDPCNSP